MDNSLSYFDDFTKIPFSLMDILQLEVQNTSKVNQTLMQRTQITFKKIYYWALVISMIFSITLSAKALIFCDPYDMQKFTLDINLSISMTTVMVKAIMLYSNAKNIIEIADDLKRGYTNQEQVRYGIKNYTNKVRTFNKIYSGFWATPFLIQFTLVLVILVVTGQKTFPFFIEFPDFFHPQNNFVYPILYIFVVWSLTSPAMVMVSFDLSFFNILTAISMEFDILTEDARNLKKLLKSQIFNHLQMIIDRQNRLFEVTSKLEESFTFSNLYYFLVASIIICLFAFIVSTSNDITQVILMGSMCVSTIYQLYLQCSYGQLLTDASAGFMDGIYDCGWEDFEDITLRKMMIFIMMRTRKPATVTYMKFGNLTKQLFTSAIWRAYSYFTLCQQIYSKV
ncbi:unnamed protein product [Chironomus riparius]|uniref:Odorant receptor n=1 Tax=Chironomus riparius TaxID=315576 RepID=A0A9N9RZY6_9DIPT|nr:unnamed protein product [Chironomus riparius]